MSYTVGVITPCDEECGAPEDHVSQHETDTGPRYVEAIRGAREMRKVPAALARPGDLVSNGDTAYQMLLNWPNRFPPGQFFVIDTPDDAYHDERERGIPEGWLTRG